MKKILEIKALKNHNGLWETPYDCLICGTVNKKNEYLHSAIVSAAYQFNKKFFKIFNITKNGFDFKFWDSEIVIKIAYNKYTVIDNIFYERDEKEINVLLRKEKLKKLNKI